MSRILLVEDDPDVGPLLEQILFSAGHSVDTAATYGGGMALVEARSYDLVITDARLPGGNGIDIADGAKLRGMKALVLTGNVSEFPRERLAPHPYLWKPIRAHELLSVVAQLLHASEV